MVERKKIFVATLPSGGHPQTARWTDEALPMPIRLQLMREEIAKVRQARRPEAPSAHDRPK